MVLEFVAVVIVNTSGQEVKGESNLNERMNAKGYIMTFYKLLEKGLTMYIGTARWRETMMVRMKRKKLAMMDKTSH
jgi:hypothetical protein